MSTIISVRLSSSQPKGHWDQNGCNSQNKWKHEACAGKEASQQSAKKRKQYTNFSDTDRAEIGQYAAEYGNTVLVKIEGGANIGNVHLQR